MPQSNVIKVKRTTVPSKVPTTSDIVAGELAANLIDKILYTRDTSNNIISLTGVVSNIAGTGISLSGTNNVTISIDSTVATLTGSQTLTNKTISGSNNTISNIGNSSLTNSSITINGTTVSLGGTATISASAGGSDTQVQYNSSNVLAGSANLTFDGTRLTAAALTVDTNTLYVDATNDRVGIGTSSPSYRLHVQNNSDTSIAYYAIAKNDGGSADGFQIVDDRGFAGVNSGKTFRVVTRNDGTNDTGAIASFETIGGSTSTRMRINIDGNVGIGTASPAEQLDLAGYAHLRAVTGNGYGYLSHQYISANSYDYWTLSSNFKRTGAAAGTIDNSLLGTAAIDLMTAGGNVGTIAFSTGVNNTVPSEKMRIDSSGNVGIGTSTPSGARLQVYSLAGGTGAAINLQNLGSGDTALSINNSGGTNRFNVRLFSTETVTGLYGNNADVWIGSNTNGTIPTKAYAYFNNTTENVGIGTTSPGTKLEVFGSITARAASTQDSVILAGRAGGTSSYGVTLTPTTLSASRTLTLPDTTGTIITTGDSGTVTSTMIADGTIVNGDINASAAIAVSKLAASTISGITLGNNLNTLTMNVSGTGLSGSTTYNGSAAATFTVTSNATSANTASAIVARDASGNFSAGTITATLSGSATSVGGITEIGLFNNMGGTHGARTSFDATTPSYNFGYRYVQGTANGPGTSGSQFYSWYIGLGSEYPATGAGSYGAMFAVDRNVTNPYLSVRYNESNSFTAWYKIRAGYADSAGSVTNTLTLATSGTGLSGSASYNGSGAVTFTVTSNATSANTASAIVARDASGNFSAGTITATTLAGTLSTAAQTNITSVGTLTSLTVSGNISIGSLGVAIDSNKNFYPGNQTSNYFTWDGFGISKVGSGYFYISNGIFYVQSTSVFRGVVSNDQATYLQINGGTSGHTYFNGNVGIGTSSPTGKLHLAGSALSITGIYQDGADRPSVGLTGNYPQLVLMSQVANSSHGPTLMLGSKNSGDTNHKHWSIGTSGQDSTFLDIGYHAGTDLNPHAGIRNYQGSTWMTILSSGNVGIGETNPGAKLHVAGAIYSSGHHYINNSDPTIFFQDTDNRSAMIHCNSNLLYFLRGSGTNSTGWTLVNGAWPLYLNLETNDAIFGGLVKAEGTYGRFATGYDSSQVNSMSCSNWFRSSGATGWYNATYDGGIWMADSTYVRVYNGKGFLVDGSHVANGQISARYGQSSGSVANATGGLGGVEIYGGGSTNAAFLTFHRPGAYAVYFGLDGTDLKVGGWSMGAVAYTMMHSGNYTTYTGNIPQESKTSAYTLVAADRGKHISITTGGVTVPASVFNTGDVVTIYNNSGSNQTITQGASTTLRFAGTANTGNRTLAQYGVATVLCVASNTFVISGNGLT